MSIADEWLDNEDKVCRSERLSRLEWLEHQFPNINYSQFHGGLVSNSLFEEARYTYVYGQYIATIMLCLSFIETTLGSLFYSFGRNDLQRASISDLLKEAKNEDLITDSEFEVFDRIRRMRNPLIHFRRPGHEERIEYRAIKEEKYFYEVIEEDAKVALGAVLKLMGKFSI